MGRKLFYIFTVLLFSLSTASAVNETKLLFPIKGGTTSDGIKVTEPLIDGFLIMENTKELNVIERKTKATMTFNVTVPDGKVAVLEYKVFIMLMKEAGVKVKSPKLYFTARMDDKVVGKHENNKSMIIDANSEVIRITSGKEHTITLEANFTASSNAQYCTMQGGIKTIVWTDALQTACLFGALLLIIYKVVGELGMTMSDAVAAISNSELSRVFVMDDWFSKQNFWKQFLSGAFIAIVMTGLDQDMMQKNLTCRSLRDAQKDMCTYGVAFVPANLLFLSLGVLLTFWYQQQGLALPAKGDELLPVYVNQISHLSPLTTHLFILGMVAAAFSSADSALTALTTSYCGDIRGRADDEHLRRRVHIGMAVVFVIFILLFRILNSTSVIDAIYILCSYTYGPLLGLFAFGLLTKRQTNDRMVPYICVASPIVCYLLDMAVGQLTGYRFGYELLMLNGLLTFSGLYLFKR